MILGNTATSLALHTATMSAMNASRNSSGYGGEVSIIYLFIILWILYATMVVLGLVMDEYKDKKTFFLDLVIPFRALYRLIKNKVVDLK